MSGTGTVAVGLDGIGFLNSSTAGEVAASLGSPGIDLGGVERDLPRGMMAAPIIDTPPVDVHGIQDLVPVYPAAVPDQLDYCGANQGSSGYRG